MLLLSRIAARQADPDTTYSDASNRERGEEPGPQWLVDGLLPHGATAIISDPGLGKSMVIQQVVHHLSYGRPLGSWPAPALGTYRTWVIDLEGDAGLNRERSYAITPYGQLEQDGRRDKRDDHFIWYTHEIIPGPLREQYATYREPADAHTAYLDAVLTDQAAAGQPLHLVIIDTLSRFLGHRPNGANAYTWEADKVGALNRLALKHGVALVLIHHTNKKGEVSGSQGIAGSCTVAARLDVTSDPDAVQRTGILKSIKVRHGSPFAYPMAQDADDGTWTFLDTLTAAQAGNMGQKRAVLDVLADKGPQSTRELARVTQIGTNLKTVLARLVRALEIRSRFGRWEISPDRGAACPGPAVPPDQPELPDDEETKVSDIEEVSGFQMLLASINASRMKPLLRMPSEERTGQPWSLITEQMRGEHRWYPPVDAPDDQTVVIFDRRGSYPSAMSSVPVAANRLVHTGTLDYRRNDVAGIFLIDEFEWTDDGIGHPLGCVVGTPGPWWISTPHLILLEKLATAGRIKLPRIIDSWTGRGTAGLFTQFSKSVKAARAAAREDPEAFEKVKRTTSIAIRCLWPKGARSPFWRPDWSVSVRAEAAVRHWVRAEQVRAGGVVVIGLGAVDEVAVLSDPDPGPKWAPHPLKVGEEYGQVSQKKVLTVSDWRVLKRLDNRRAVR